MFMRPAFAARLAGLVDCDIKIFSIHWRNFITMKMPLTIIALLFLFSCSNGRNELMTALVNNKKALEDSIKDATNYEHYYMQQAKTKMRSDSDTTAWHVLVDSSTHYYMKGREYQARLEATGFSIDSLSKMK